MVGRKTVPQLNSLASNDSLVVSTGLVALCSVFLVDSINGVISRSGLSETFVGLILLPLVGNAAEVLMHTFFPLPFAKFYCMELLTAVPHRRQSSNER